MSTMTLRLISAFDEYSTLVVFNIYVSRTAIKYAPRKCGNSNIANMAELTTVSVNVSLSKMSFSNATCVNI